MNRSDIIEKLPRNLLDNCSAEIVGLSEGGQQWLSYLDSDARANICHHPAWGSIFRETFGFDSFLILHRTGGRIDGGLPLVSIDQRITGRALISMPFINYGGILGQNHDTINDIVTVCRDIVKSGSYGFVELRHLKSGHENLTDKSEQKRITFQLDINRPIDDIFGGFKKQMRTRIRKSEKQGLTFYQGQERIEDFYNLFAQGQKELGTPVLPKRYFISVFKHLANHALMMIAYKNDVPVGGKLIIKFKDRVIMTRGCYPKRHKNLLANYYLTWILIQQLALGPYRILDFGRSAPGSGGHLYKSNWGPEEIPIYTDYIVGDPDSIPDLKPESSRYRYASTVWRKLPLSLTKLVGPKLSRYFT